jgi:hypothetical protein
MEWYLHSTERVAHVLNSNKGDSRFCLLFSARRPQIRRRFRSGLWRTLFQPWPPGARDSPENGCGGVESLLSLQMRPIANSRFYVLFLSLLLSMLLLETKVPVHSSSLLDLRHIRPFDYKLLPSVWSLVPRALLGVLSPVKRKL